MPGFELIFVSGAREVKNQFSSGEYLLFQKAEKMDRRTRHSVLALVQELLAIVCCWEKSPFLEKCNTYGFL